MVNHCVWLSLLNRLVLRPSDDFWKYVCNMIRKWRHCLPQTHRPKDPGWWKGGLWCKYTRLSRRAKHTWTLRWRGALPPPIGHPEETSEQRSDRAAGPDRCSLRVQEERGGGADRPEGQDRESHPTTTVNSLKGHRGRKMSQSWVFPLNDLT